MKIGCRRGKRTAVHPKRKAKRISKENSKRKLGVEGEKELLYTQNDCKSSHKKAIEERFPRKLSRKGLTRKQRKNDADQWIKMEAIVKENSVMLV